MKFAALALIATAAAVKIQAQGECVDNAESAGWFKKIDTNGNGQINKEELVSALNAYAQAHHYAPTKADWAWVAKSAYADAGKDKTLSAGEFHKWINQFAQHFHIDGCK